MRRKREKRKGRVRGREREGGGAPFGKWEGGRLFFTCRKGQIARHSLDTPLVFRPLAAARAFFPALLTFFFFFFVLTSLLMQPRDVIVH